MKSGASDHIVARCCPANARVRIWRSNVTGPVEVVTHLDEAHDGTRSLVSIIRDVSERKQAEQIRPEFRGDRQSRAAHAADFDQGRACGCWKSGVAGDLGEDAGRMVRSRGATATGCWRSSMTSWCWRNCPPGR
jgi:hypothetical protein